MASRRLLALWLLTPAALLGQDARQASDKKVAKPLAPVVGESFKLPWKGSLPPPPAEAGVRPRTPSEVQTSFAEREQARLDEHERRVASEVARIRQAGGLQALWKDQLEQARKPAGSGPPGRRTEMISAELRARLESFAVCQTPTLFGIWNFGAGDPTVTPGYSMLIQGCHLGTSPGTIKLTATGTGINFVVTPTSWSDDHIWANVDKVTGIQDSPCVLQITTSTGDQSNATEVLVTALRATTILAARPQSFVLTGECADTTDYDNCASVFKDPGFTIVGHSVGGIHWSRCCFNGVSGTDRYFVSLKNGWTVWDVGQLSDWSLTTCDADWGNDRGHVDQPTGYAHGTPSTEIDVSWWVDANCSEAYYFFDIYATGPSGVPFE